MAALMESVLAVRTSSEPFLDKYEMEASTSECTGASGVVTFGSSVVYGERPVALKFFVRRADYDSELDGCKRAIGPHTIAVVDFVAPFAGRGTRGRIARCARRAVSCASAPCTGGVVAPTRTRTRPGLGGDAPARWFGGGPLSALQPALVYKDRSSKPEPKQGVGPPSGIGTQARRGALCRYGCIVFERGDVTLAEHWRLKRHGMSDIQKHGILHKVAARAGAVCARAVRRRRAGPVSVGRAPPGRREGGAVGGVRG